MQRTARFPLTARMDEEAGYVDFTALNIPLYVLLLWGLFGGGRIYTKHPEYQFRTVISWALIVGAGVYGALDLSPLV